MVETRTPSTLTAADPVMRLVHRTPVWVHLDTTLRACAQIMAEESKPAGDAGRLAEPGGARYSDRVGVPRDLLVPLELELMGDPSALRLDAADVIRLKLRRLYELPELSD